MIKTYIVELKGANRRADKSVSFKCESTTELSSVEFGEVDACLGGIGVLALTDNQTGLNDEDMKKVEEMIKLMPERDTLEGKTLSQQQRALLYVQCEQKLGRRPTTEEFAQYYKRSVTAINDKIRATLE